MQPFLETLINYNHPLNERIWIALNVPSPGSRSCVPGGGGGLCVEAISWPLCLSAWRIHMSDQEEPGCKLQTKLWWKSDF